MFSVRARVRAHESSLRAELACAPRQLLPAAPNRTPRRPRRSLIAGVREAAPAAHFVLCLDDDVQLQPGVLTRLVQDMQADSTLAMATGAKDRVARGHITRLTC